MTYREPQVRPLEVNNGAGCSAKASLPVLPQVSPHFGPSPQCSSSPQATPGSPSVPNALPSLCAGELPTTQQMTVTSSAKLILLPRPAHPFLRPHQPSVFL